MRSLPSRLLASQLQIFFTRKDRTHQRVAGGRIPETLGGKRPQPLFLPTLLNQVLDDRFTQIDGIFLINDLGKLSLKGKRSIDQCANAFQRLAADGLGGNAIVKWV